MTQKGLVVEERSHAKRDLGFVPYAIASAFMKNLYREESSTERIPDDQERMSSPLAYRRPEFSRLFESSAA